MTVLICEDEEIMLTAISFRMRKQGFNVVIAQDGREALDKIAEYQPDFIVTDIMVPFVSGLEIVTTLRNDRQSQVPIIVMSALDQEETILEAFRRGANDFIAKPFKPNELILRIKKIIQEKQPV